MSPIISARHLRKHYDKTAVLNDISFTVQPGRIYGLIGPNGAGKTTLLKSILGLAKVEGEIEVLGQNPAQQRAKLLEQVSFIADTAIMPRWLKVKNAVEYFYAMHPRFDRDKAKAFLANTQIHQEKCVKHLSKGMVTQLHLALIMAIDSQLLVLDEPTLGLDIIYRQKFYTALLNDYFDEKKTLIITTHQVEEIEDLLTDVMFIHNGSLVVNASMEEISSQFTKITVNKLNYDHACALQPIHISPRMGTYDMIFENVHPSALEPFGQIVTPKLSELFVAKIAPSLSPSSATANTPLSHAQGA